MNLILDTLFTLSRVTSETVAGAADEACAEKKVYQLKQVVVKMEHEEKVVAAVVAGWGCRLGQIN